MDIRLCFNPHPAFWPDATCHLSHLSRGYVWFQSSPGLLAGCNSHLPVVGGHVDHVSILTRPSGRMQHQPGDHVAQVVRVSILTRPSGRMQQGCFIPIRAVCDVSILTRPSGRMQPRGLCVANDAPRGFNPHPAFWPDATLYLNFLSVLREPPDMGLPTCSYCPDHFFPPATIQLRTRTSRLQ